MNGIQILKTPMYVLGTMTYDEYAQLLSDVLAYREELTGIQERETSTPIFALRKVMIDQLDAMKHAMSLHPHYEKYCATLMAPVPQPEAA